MLLTRYTLATTLLLLQLPVHAQMQVNREILQRGIPKGSIRPAATISQQTSSVLSGPYKSVSFVVDTVGPRIYSRNIPEVVTFTTPVELPSEAPITQVSWKYSLAQHPQGIEVKLCLGQQLCHDVTRNEIGRTSLFNGKHAGSAFTMQYIVRGSEMLGRPITGGTNQIIVTYAVPLTATEMID
jgi:hypothetical protein